MCAAQFIKRRKFLKPENEISDSHIIISSENEKSYTLGENENTLKDDL